MEKETKTWDEEKTSQIEENKITLNLRCEKCGIDFSAKTLYFDRITKKWKCSDCYFGKDKK
jgi:protein-arginine kinase activator protein McsA